MTDRPDIKRFASYVRSGQGLAEARDLSWSFPVGKDGRVSTNSAWDLSKVCRAITPPVYRLDDFRFDQATVRVISARANCDGPELGLQVLPDPWQMLIKAVVAHKVAARRVPSHINFVARVLRVLATCAVLRLRHHPSDLDGDTIEWALSVAAEIGGSGKLQEMLRGLVTEILDVEMICEKGPFAHRLGNGRRRVAEAAKPRFGRVQDLDDRDGAEKLPSAEPFWDLADISFTRRAKTFVDELRFAQLRVLFLCGLRVSEAASIPLDWIRETEHFTQDGSPAGDASGISRTLSLRHFAAKQRGKAEASIAWTESTMSIPPQFEAEMRSTLGRVAMLVEPLRARLRRQIETGRVFPEFVPDELIPLIDAYPRLTGNPILLKDQPLDLLAAYRETFDPGVLNSIREHQEAGAAAGAPFANTFQAHWAHLNASGDGPPLRDATGAIQRNARMGYASLFVRAEELERYVAEKLPTKLSDRDGMAFASGGRIEAPDLLFLMPKRSLIDGRNDGVIDVLRYCAIGRVTSADLIKQMSDGPNSFFSRYGGTELARPVAASSMKTHSLRHLQNTVLFSAGISDAIITKRFNRQSVAQSAVYDHRTLAERLDAIDLPPEADGVSENVRNVARMISTERFPSRIGEEFKRVSAARGVEAAYEFLAAEGGGFHATPYGHCIHDFSQSPCPKSLQCFGGCNHFMSTGLTSNRTNLESLLRKMEIALDAVTARTGSVGRENQLAQLTTQIAGLRTILDGIEDRQVFPDGPDLSKPILDGVLLDA